MPRKNNEWMGRTPDAQPPSYVIDRLLAKANHKCQGPCGQPVGPGRPFDVDHIIELADGGENRESNLQILCRKICHAKKSGDRHADRSKERRVYRHLAGWKKRSRFRGWRRLDGSVVWADQRKRNWVREDPNDSGDGNHIPRHSFGVLRGNDSEIMGGDMNKEKTHRELVLQAEITARNAANVEYRGRIDILEEGIREAKLKIEELQRELEFRRTAGGTNEKSGSVQKT